MSGIYIHIPFCKQACSYCDFYFVTRKHQQQAFVDALVDEILAKKCTRYAKEKIRTIYFGGGTPSLLTPAQIEQVFKALESSFILDIKECTMELNPDDVTKEYLQSIHSLGITRASMGFQSFEDHLLTFMHRAHTSTEAIQSLELLAKEGFNSFTVDLIYGNPNQTIESLNEDLEILTSFNPPHVSAYSLTIEHGTRLGKQAELGKINPLSDEKVTQHVQIVRDSLSDGGIDQYEVSNYAKHGHEAKHNSAYWSHENYLGFGPSAHSFWWEKGSTFAQRWNNKRDIMSYVEGGWKNENEMEYLNLYALAEERLMLGLRTNNGLNLHVLKEEYEFSFTEKQLMYLTKKNNEGILTLSKDQLKLTNEGLLITDLILLDLITA